MATWKKVLVSGSSAELSALTLDTQLAVGQGGTGATTLTDGGVLLGSGTGAISATAVLGNGELLIGDGSGDPSVATLTGTSNEVEISNGAGSITIGLPNDVTIGQDLTVTRNLSNSGAVADSQITGSFTGSFSGDGSNLTGLTSANNSTITLSPGAGLAALGDFTLNQGGDETITIGVDGVLEDLDTLGAAASDGQVIVATGAGAFAYESGATLRSSIGVDAAGTDNSTDVTLVTTSHDYLSISGQAITLNTVDIGDDTNLTGGTNITLDGDTLNVDDAFLINSGNDSTSGTITAAGFIATGNISGSVTATGSFGRIETAGNLVPKAHNTSDLGSSTNRWANIYSADLQLSNMDNDEGNEVDGTKGSWTIQEGEDDLYLLNRKNGKKYKFKLEEIT